MAKSSDEIQRDIELKRQQLHVRVNKLRERVTDDVRTVKHQTREELTGYLHKTEAQVAEHPWLAIAGGFGSGVALGITKPGSSSGHKAASHDGSASGQGESLLSKGFGAVMSATGGPVFDEVRSTLQDSLTEIRSTLQDSVSDVLHELTGKNGREAKDSAASGHGVREHAAA